MPKTQYFTDEMGENVFVFQPSETKDTHKNKPIYTPRVFSTAKLRYRVARRPLKTR